MGVGKEDKMFALNNNQKFLKAAAIMDKRLSASTGLDELDRQLLVYCTMATHMLPNLSTFPLLNLTGPTGTGKTQALLICANFAYGPQEFCLRGMTAATIRDAFARCYEGTAILEEADSGWNDQEIERMLSDRSSRGSANESHKVRDSEKNWKPLTQKYFGATFLHRRTPFRDAALDGRTVQVRFRPDHTRQYREFDPKYPSNQEGHSLIQGLTFEPPVIEQVPGVAGRIFNTYKPLIAAARFCRYQRFERLIETILTRQTLELKEAQASEPDALVVQAIVEAVCGWRTQFQKHQVAQIIEIHL